MSGVRAYSCYEAPAMLCLENSTDAAWAEAASDDIDAVLADHAHCEMKAASSALSLAARQLHDPKVALELTDLAREEIDHFQQVLRLLGERGKVLGPPAVDEYVAALLKSVQTLPKTQLPPLVDRLLAAALIEARSCERFKLLIAALRSRDPNCAIAALYEELMPTEARHYRTFVELATHVAGGDSANVRKRLAEVARAEGAIVEKLGASEVRGTIHG